MATDASSFEVIRADDVEATPVDESGQPQIQVKAGTKLDHETKASYTVRLTANDGSGASNNSASITVTIMVTDDDEMPTIKDRSDAAAIVRAGRLTYNYKPRTAQARWRPSRPVTRRARPPLSGR